MLGAVLTIAGDRVAMPAMVLAAAAVSLAAASDGESGTTICLFRRCTGGYCPGCGGSRAAWALLRGDLTGSWALHPWVPLLVGQLFIAALVMFRSGREPVRRFLVPVLVANLMLGLAIWMIRISTGAIPVPFG